MSLAHFIYIPAVMLVALVIGYILGGRAALNAKADREEAGRRRAARRARRDQAERDAAEG